MNIWRPYTQMQDASEQVYAVKAEGSYIHLRNGRKIFDGISSWWVITHGHCNPQISEAIAAQAAKLDQVVLANFIHEPAEALVDELSSILPPSLDTVFFSDNGSTSVEVALKMAYQYVRLTGNRSKNKFCSFKNSYHGDTFGAMSVTADDIFTKPYNGLRLDVIRCGQGFSSTDELHTWIGKFSKNIHERCNEIVAVIIEPMLQGAGGMIAWTKEALNRICELCRQHDVLLIFDEVMTGFGRTGKQFAFEHLNYVPDFVCLSKGLTGGSLPLALTLTSKKIYDAFLSNDSSKMFFHGRSFAANSISCAAACASVRLFKKNPVLSDISLITEGHKRAIDKIKQRIQLSDSRVVGSVGVIELSNSSEYGGQFSKKLLSSCTDKGLFIRPLGNVIYLMSPYCSKAEEVEWAWEAITESIQQIDFS